MRLCLTIACAAIAPVLVAASQPVRLQPSSPWDVDYGENSCRLIRTFAEGKEKTVLVFESAGPGQMDLLVVGNGLKGYGGDSDNVPARFLPSAASRSAVSRPVRRKRAHLGSCGRKCAFSRTRLRTSSRKKNNSASALPKAALVRPLSILQKKRPSRRRGLHSQRKPRTRDRRPPKGHSRNGSVG